MYCKKCGAALPSDGFICHNCGALMSKEQIDKQNNYIREQKKNDKRVVLLSEKYNGGVRRDYTLNDKKEGENRFLGILFIGGVIIVLIIIAVIRVMV